MKKLFLSLLLITSSIIVSCNTKQNENLESLESLEVTANENFLENEENVESQEETIETTQEILSFQTIPSGEYMDTISERAILNVEYTDGIYNFEINWSNSATEKSRWTFSGEYLREINGIEYDNCKCEIVKNDGKTEDITIKYENGEGVILFEGRKLFWNDLNEEKVYDENYNGIFTLVE